MTFHEVLDHYREKVDLVTKNLEHIFNGDVRWEGTYRGFSPRMDEDLFAQFDADDPDDVATLVEALATKDRFVAAHVLLTRVSGIEYSAFPDWNSLRLQMQPDGGIDIDMDQRSELARRWALWQQTDPRPRTLPA